MIPQVPPQPSSPETWEPAIYESLSADKKEVRLLHLSGGERDDEINCKLETVSLINQDHTPYETVSYVWGDSSIRSGITLHGLNFDAPASSAAVLRCLRLQDKVRVLWIDAICINQKDLSERSKQVSMMGEIYRQSIGNVVFLGDDGEAEQSVGYLKSVIARLEARRHELSENDKVLLDYGACPLAWRNSDFISNDDMIQLQWLYRRPYFSRVWVVQEAALAPQNTCWWSGITFPLNDALRIARQWMGFNKYDRRHIGMKIFLPAVYMWQHVNPEKVILPVRSCRMLYTTSVRLNATDPRDHVFALNELFRINAGLKTLPAYMEPDYEADIITVYGNATFAFLSLDCDYIWSHQYFMREMYVTDDRVPSWLINWKVVTRMGSMDVNCHAGRLGDSRPHGAMHVERCGPSGAMIKIEGFLVGAVVESRAAIIAEEMETARLLVSCLQDVRNMIVRAIKPETMSMDDLDRMVVHLAARGQLSREFDEWDQVVRGYLQLRIFAASPASRMITNWDGLQGLGLSYYRAAGQELRDRCLFRTENTSFGSGPMFTRPGDKVFIPVGGMYAHVVRPSKDGTYHYVGAAYLHGYMHGEVLRSGCRSEWITLR